MKTVITLGDMQAKGMRMLEVACRKCARRGRLSIARLIAEHGREDCDLRALIAHDCPKMREPQASIYELAQTIPSPGRHRPVAKARQAQRQGERG